MRLHRFYVSQPLGEDVVINDVSIIKQWLKVFRYTTGVSVILFNGDGNDCTYSIESITPTRSCLKRLESHPSFIPLKNIALYLSLIKKDNFELVVQKATELGVTKIVPIISSRSEKKSLNQERLLKIAVEASEQCGRGNLPIIAPILSLNDVFKMEKLTNVSFVLQMGGVSWNETLISNKGKGDTISIFIGPEGGWSTDEEKLFADKKVRSVSLGNTVLRAETAAIVACAFACL